MYRGVCDLSQVQRQRKSSQDSAEEQQSWSPAVLWVYHEQRNFTRLNSTTWENPKDVLMFIREFKKLQCSEGGIRAVSGGRKAKALTQTTMLQQNRIPEGEATLDGSDKVQRLQLSTQK